MGQSKGKIAAPRVFAIPELLEAVLLHVSWSDLFVRQRVNKAFSQVIAESQDLQKKMKLHLLTMPRYMHRGSPLLQEFSWTNFNFELFSTNSITTRKMDLSIKLIYDTWFPKSSTPKRFFPELGIGKQMRHTYSVDSRGTWQALKLTDLTGMVWIHVNVVFHVATAHRTVLGYRDLVALKAENATFGDMAGVLSEMKHRLPEEHIKLYRAKNLQIGLRQFTDAKCIRGDSRERVKAVVAWEGREVDFAMTAIEHRRESRRCELDIAKRRKAEEEENLDRDLSGPW